ncbi:glutamate dehydrogenase [Moraxella caviae]|uniref:Glutamate dehydrogenase n=1 Tax=Moraxella caviae TaxID=34060 RepID=A0A1T0A8Z8_9GAMM|nr:NAD-glutamate dehydrogenase [Moraxella caviae]OOR92109.1 glutamate dehydrogenase [Moraxella caviae]STZ14468.1 NAD-specific glutamate dehydrogenase [Moraxella caviae]
MIPLTIDQKRLENIAKIARSHVASQDAALLDEFIKVYYQYLHADDAANIDDVNLAGMALHHFSLLKHHNGQNPKVAVINPVSDEHHFHSGRTVVQLVALDRPFLTDTMLMGLEKLGISVHRIYTNIIKAVRDDAGALTDVVRTDESNSTISQQFSFLHCEIDRQADGDLARIQKALLERITTLDIVVADHTQMRDRLDGIIQDMARLPLPTEQSSKEEITSFLDWIRDDHFIFLGFREYSLDGSGDVPELYTVGGSGLGVLRENGENGLSKSFHRLPDELKHLLTVPRVLLLSKSSHESPVHRPVYMDFLGIHKYDETGKLVGEYRFVGLLTSQAYQMSVREIPLLREKAEKILALSNLPKNSHAYLKLAHIVNTLPRDDLFQANIDELYPAVTAIAQLQDKNRLRLLARTDHYQRFVSCLVYIPRHKFDTALRRQMQEMLTEAFGGISSNFTTEFNELHHARVHIHVRTVPGQVKAVDLPALERKLTALMQDWTDDYARVLGEVLGESRANELLRDYAAHIPAAYQERYDVHTAVADTQRMLALSNDEPLIWHLYQSAGESVDQLRLKLYGLGEPSALSNVLPILENFGVSVINSQTFKFATSTPAWLQEYKLKLRTADAIDLAVVRSQFELSLKEIWAGNIESDRLNELVLTTDLDAYHVLVLRALSRYMVQARAPFSSDYIHQTLTSNANLARLIVDLFIAKMSPDVADDERAERMASVKAAIDGALANVASLDEDRIIRWFLDLIDALLRTNFYQLDQDGKRKDRVSFKFAASRIPHLPKPKPMFEIYVYSPRIEGVHLRGGKVARGGLRWSDRMEDYRTEVLGLVKAQMVKNAVIVPVGSKGGFVCKDRSKAGNRETWQAEGVACYQTFIRGLLDVTDNLVDGKVVPPARTVRHDEDDPYLVVAADKGTATFSDIANALSAEYGFWLQDAFASGGSAGYDHKGMGITARGAWESVKRHFRLMDKDIQQKDDFTVVGIGDMSGDVFGNGMLLSRHIRLQAAFNHLHIFIDPNPDAAKSYAERERLFNLPRSMWTDYDSALISEGGGVFNRSDKSIKITPQMQVAFDIAEDELTPNELLNKLLKAPVDLIWNGGIGTYIKSSDEDHADVGDRANDAIRVNGNEVRAKVVGEGGNLGCTQKGRIEYAQNGGRIYTDAIDNSGGVNCSDHEVNIKILLGAVVEQGDMTTKQRNALLESMTDDVAQLVLRQNYLQPQAIELSAREAAQRLGEHQRFMQFLESANRLDRAIEYLPSDDAIAQRQKAGRGLTNPEFAVLLAYGKMWVYDEMLASDLTDDAYFLHELKKYFPNALTEPYYDEMVKHRLHREIISTYLTNGLVNRLGMETVYRLHDETGKSIADITRAYAVVRDVFGAQAAWNQLEALDNKANATLLLDIELGVREALKQGMVWFLTNADLSDVAQTAQSFKTAIATLMENDSLVQTHFADVMAAQVETLNLTSLDADAAAVFARLPIYVQALDVVALAHQKQQNLFDVASVYFAMSDALGMAQLNALLETLPAQSYWDRRANLALSLELNRTLLALVGDVLSAHGADGFGAWQQKQAAKLAALTTQRESLKDPAQKVGLAALSVLLSEMNGLKAS